MSKDLAREKRVQAGLSLGGAALGLSALGTKGGAVAARQAVKRAPALAGRLKLTPKVAEGADKASIGLVTTASGVGGASGIHFARLQQAEAKREETVAKDAFGVSKAVYDMEAKRREADLARAKQIGQSSHRRALREGRFVRVGQDPEDYPRTPQRPTKPAVRPILAGRHPRDFGGINPEARRQRRMQGEQAGLAGVAAASTAVAVGDKRKAAGNVRQAVASARKSKQLKRQSKAYATYKDNVRAPFRGNYKLQRMNISRQQVSAGKKAVTHLKWAGRDAVRIKPKMAALAVAAGAGSYGVSRMRRRQGKKYTDWWDA